MSRFVIAVGPNAKDGHPVDYLRRLAREVEVFLVARNVCLSEAMRAANFAANEATETDKDVVYLTEADVWHYLKKARQAA